MGSDSIARCGGVHHRESRRTSRGLPPGRARGSHPRPQPALASEIWYTNQAGMSPAISEIRRFNFRRARAGGGGHSRRDSARGGDWRCARLIPSCGRTHSGALPKRVKRSGTVWSLLPTTPPFGHPSSSRRGALNLDLLAGIRAGTDRLGPSPRRTAVSLGGVTAPGVVSPPGGVSLLDEGRRVAKVQSPPLRGAVAEGRGGG